LRKILVFLEITLPKNDAPIMTTAQLRWVESIDLNNNIYHLGLKFVDISSEDRNILTKFILQHI
ncbi:MAG: PilZ domain-containing protein, partial [Planctomycetota bacterium]